MRIRALCLLAAAALLAGCAETRRHMGGPAQNDENVLTGGPRSGTTLDKLPVPVKATLIHRVPHAEVKDIDTTRREGRVMYEIYFYDHQKICVFEDGEVVTSSAEKK